MLPAPATIAVIGASRRENTIGHQIRYNLLTFGFAGAVYPVNPSAKSICGVRADRHVVDAPDPVDVGIIVVPTERVVETVIVWV